MTRDGPGWHGRLRLSPGSAVGSSSQVPGAYGQPEGLARRKSRDIATATGSSQASCQCRGPVRTPRGLAGSVQFTQSPGKSRSQCWARRRRPRRAPPRPAPGRLPWPADSESESLRLSLGPGPRSQCQSRRLGARPGIVTITPGPPAMPGPPQPLAAAAASHVRGGGPPGLARPTVRSSQRPRDSDRHGDHRLSHPSQTNLKALGLRLSVARRDSLGREAPRHGHGPVLSS